MANNHTLSFIIPALNEQTNIAAAIQSIRQAMHNTAHEVIVADNGSTDNTQSVAEQLGATVITDKSANIGQLRNLGVAESTGSILIFIDADVCLATDWLQCLLEEIKNWPTNQLIVTGSTCLVPESASFIEKNWFSKLQSTGTQYINSGHLITTKTAFECIGGFDKSLKTAEDYDFCQRAKASGAALVKAPNIKAFHHGYPKTVAAFILREAWHGRDDVSSFKKFKQSKTAIAACANTLLILSGLLFFLGPQDEVKGLSLLSVSAAISLALTYAKFGKDKFQSFIKTSLCFQLYLIGRTLSILIGKQRPLARS
jgi:glycosyltransferase involved in cell wall biosynthesis